MLYINGRFLTQPMTGVERYAYNMCRTLVDLGQQFAIICPRNGQIQPCYDTTGLTIVRYGRGSSHLWEQLVLPFFFLRRRDSLLVSFMGLGTVLVKRKVMTIHDLSFLENPKWFSKAYYLYYKVMTPLAARTSRHIITVSEFSKREILRFYPFLSADRISVIYSAPDADRFTILTDTPSPSQPFILAVSSLDPRKNFARLIEAVGQLEGCQLRIVGRQNRVFSHQADNADGNYKADVQFLGRVSDGELIKLYNQATCFVFPSVYEGFGLPPLEAMRCGCPVLAADIPVVREVCGDAALYFNPLDVADMRNTIAHFLTHAEAQGATMRAKGFQRAAQFTWPTSASAVMRIVAKTM